MTDCPACAAKRLHTDEELAAHKYVGHGFTPDTGWTHKDLKPKVMEVVKP